MSLNKYSKKRVVFGFTASPISIIVAKILKEQGMQISAYSFITQNIIGDKICLNSPEKLTGAAKELEMELHIEDVSNIYFAEVVDKYISARIMGKVFNPCFAHKVMILNQLYLRAIKERADYIALGLFARADSNVSLAKEEAIDQSLLIAFSEIPSQKLMLPLGGFFLKDLSRFASNMGIQNIDNALLLEKDCSSSLSNKNSINELSVYVPSFLKSKGQIVNNQEYVIGYHNGIFFSSIGDNTMEYTPVKGRASLGFENNKVVEINAEENIIIVGNDVSLQKNKAIAFNVKWKQEPNLFNPRELLLKFDNGKLENANIYYSIGNSVLIEFIKPSFSAFRGRKVAFYEKKELLGTAEIGSQIKEEVYI